MYANELENYAITRESSILFPRRGEWEKLNKEQRGRFKNEQVRARFTPRTQRMCTNSRYKKRPFAGRRKTKGLCDGAKATKEICFHFDANREREVERNGKKRETKMTNRLVSRYFQVSGRESSDKGETKI